ncbi:Asparaginase/glutaminase [Polychaeton citri CBS 116435]|uniref:asparaginase n=1 Tax=Polychaeton citri CBS 116435 TaxID=1314669 RepID=A0A9P4Q6T6_9PEZI|nr:Asparaginase/glutaminase [Polychaeton citri CBS 116435]
MLAHTEPRVLLIVAGGTICMQDSPTGLVPSKLFLEEAIKPKQTFNDGTDGLVDEVVDEHGSRRSVSCLRLPRDRYGANVRCTVLEFDPLIDSSSAHSPTWNQLSTVVRANQARYESFVICHGTDTLAYTAAALSFMLKDLDKTVILTGSQKSMFFPDSDGSNNLLGSLVLSSHLRVPEVCVYFGNSLFRGSRVTKVSASNYSGFESPNARPLAEVSESGITVHWDDINQASRGNGFNSNSVPEVDSSKVVVLKVFPGITAKLVGSMLNTKGVSGVVLETFGAGNMPLGMSDDILETIRQAVQRGVVVVNITQCLHGSVTSSYEPARKLADAGITPGFDMTTEAAFTKLIYLLASSQNSSDVARKMSTNICGELTPPETDEADKQFASIAQLPIRYVRSISGRDFQSIRPSKL